MAGAIEDPLKPSPTTCPLLCIRLTLNLVVAVTLSLFALARLPIHSHVQSSLNATCRKDKVNTISILKWAAIFFDRFA